jgi:hypothetical protein
MQSFKTRMGAVELNILDALFTVYRAKKCVFDPLAIVTSIAPIVVLKLCMPITYTAHAARMISRLEFDRDGFELHFIDRTYFVVSPPYV